MGDKLQVSTLKRLVEEQRGYIKQLEYKISVRDKIIQQYQSAFKDTNKKQNDAIEEYFEMLEEVKKLRDSYKQAVSEIYQIKSEYDSSLLELISSVRASK